MPKKTVLRSCAVCREKKEKCDLLRIVRRPTGEVEIDLTGKKSGRGAYICLNNTCIENAKKTKKIDSALKTEVPAEIYDQVKQYVNSEK